MDLAGLRLLIDVAHAGSFAAVARSQGIDPSLISRRIAKLEEDLGFRLFQRSTRQISLTESGRRFVESVQEHIDAIEDAKQVGRDQTDHPRGLLRVTTSSSFGNAVLAPLLSEFRELFPDVELELLLTDRRIDLIEEGVDLAIRLGALDDSGMIARRIMPVSFRLYVAPGIRDKLPVPQSPKDLEAIDCLTYPGSSADGTLLVDMGGERRSVTLSGKTAVSNALAMKQCAVDGLGPALLPDWLVKDDVVSGLLIGFQIGSSNLETQTPRPGLYIRREHIYRLRCVVLWISSPGVLPAKTPGAFLVPAS